MNDDDVTPEQPRYTVEQLGAYLDRGRQPYDPEIEESPENLSTLRTLERIKGLSGTVLSDDAQSLPALGDDWFGTVLDNVRREARAGRDIPLTSSSPGDTLSISEGAVRGLVRQAGDGVDGVLVGRCRIHGDVSDRAAEVSIEVTATVFWGTPMADAARAVRERIYSTLLTHTELSISAIDVVIVDVYLPEGGTDV